MSQNGGSTQRGPVGSPSATIPVRRRVGRPPKLDRQMIAEAAHDIGLTGLTMKAVADRLGVSVPGLYHHIDGKEDLLRLTAEYSAARIELPKDRGQHWAVWLYEWAHYNRDAFMAQPELLKQFIEGAIGADRTAATYEVVLSTLVREGFSIREAAAGPRRVPPGAGPEPARGLPAPSRDGRGDDDRPGSGRLPRGSAVHPARALRGAARALAHGQREVAPCRGGRSARRVPLGGRGTSGRRDGRAPTGLDEGQETISLICSTGAIVV